MSKTYFSIFILFFVQVSNLIIRLMTFSINAFKIIGSCIQSTKARIIKARKMFAKCIYYRYLSDSFFRITPKELLLCLKIYYLGELHLFLATTAKPNEEKVSPGVDFTNLCSPSKNKQMHSAFRKKKFAVQFNQQFSIN